jgi:hypothetical protein
MINRYKGYCKCCDSFVKAGEGFYDLGYTWCGELIVWPSSPYGYICVSEWNRKNGGPIKSAESIRAEMKAEAEKAEHIYRETLLNSLVYEGGLEELAEKANVRSLQAVITKVVGDKALAMLDFSDAIAVREELYKRINRKNRKKELVEYKNNGICWRCGGAGKSDRWMYTGYVCYECGGTGKA